MNESMNAQAYGLVVYWVSHSPIVARCSLLRAYRLEGVNIRGCKGTSDLSALAPRLSSRQSTYSMVAEATGSNLRVKPSAKSAVLGLLETLLWPLEHLTIL